MKSLEVCILTRGGSAVLDNCLESLYAALAKTGMPDFTVNVLINGDLHGESVPTSACKSHFTQLKMDRVPHQVGFSSGNNHYLRATQSEAVLLLNDDTTLAPNSLIELVNQFRSNPRFACLGANLSNSDGSPQMSGGRMPGIISALRNGLFFERTALAIKPIQPLTEVEWVSGTCMLLRVSALRQVGIFDEDFDPFYGEDMDLSVRMCQKGWAVGICRDAHVIHLGGKSFVGDVETRYFHIFHGFMTFMRKYKPQVAQQSFRLIWTLGSVIRVAIAIAMLSVNKQEGKRRLSGAIGAIRGLWAPCQKQSQARNKTVKSLHE